MEPNRTYGWGGKVCYCPASGAIKSAGLTSPEYPRAYQFTPDPRDEEISKLRNEIIVFESALKGEQIYNDELNNRNEKLREENAKMREALKEQNEDVIAVLNAESDENEKERAIHGLKPGEHILSGKFELNRAFLALSRSAERASEVLAEIKKETGE